LRRGPHGSQGILSQVWKDQEPPSRLKVPCSSSIETRSAASRPPAASHRYDNQVRKRSAARRRCSADSTRAAGKIGPALVSKGRGSSSGVISASHKVSRTGKPVASPRRSETPESTQLGLFEQGQPDVERDPLQTSVTHGRKAR
jgi:hypothetical protein